MIFQVAKQYIPRAKIYGKILIIAIPIAVGVVGLGWGPGIFNRPNIRISCGAIDLGVPSKQAMELLMIRFSLSSDEIRKKMISQLPQTLREYGLSEDKIAIMRKDMEHDTSDSSLKFSQREERIVRAAAGKVTVDITDALRDQMIIPDTVLFFQVDNSGRAGTEDARITVRVDGTICNYTFDSDNKHGSEKKGNEIVIDLKNIAPGSINKGIVWLSSDNHNNTEKNEVAISHRFGTTRHSFKADEFYLKPD